MVLFNYSTKELTAKVVYYGPGLCGKTTNLHWIHEKLPIKNKGKMLSLATETDRTLFFDFLPIELGSIRGMKTRIQLYTVPGQVFYNATRRMVLKGADCIVFVADSQEAMIDANLESMENLRQNLEANELDATEIPLVLQYNKRDLPNALPIEILNERMNPRNVPFFEAVAIKGQGVEETLKGVTQLVFRSLATRYGGADAAAAAKAPAPQSAPPPRPVAAPPPPPVLPTMDVAADDSLLDSLELHPAEASDFGEEISLDTPLVESLVEIDALDVELPVPAMPAPPPRPAVGKATLISAPQEAEDLRRRIARPSVPDLRLEELGVDEDDDFDELAMPVPARPPARPSATPQRVGVTTLPPGGPAAAAIATPPVAVALPRAGPATDVTIPVEVRIGEGEAQVAIHIRLTLSLKLQS